MTEAVKEWEEKRPDRLKTIRDMQDYFEEIYQAKVQRAKIKCGDFS